MRSKIGPEAHPIFRQLTPVENYLTQLERVQFDMYDPSLTSRNHFLAFNLLAKRWRGKF